MIKGGHIVSRDFWAQVMTGGGFRLATTCLSGLRMNRKVPCSQQSFLRSQSRTAR